MKPSGSNHGHRRPVLLLLLAFFATGCFGEFEDPVTNMPATLSIQLSGTRDSYGEPDEPAGYTILISEQDAHVQGIEGLETPLIADTSGIPIAVFELTSFIHPRIEDVVTKTCFSDPIIIRHDERQETVATLHDLCPDLGNASRVDVIGVLDDRPFAWSLNSKQIFPDESP